MGNDIPSCRLERFFYSTELAIVWNQRTLFPVAFLIPIVMKISMKAQQESQWTVNIIYTLHHRWAQTYPLSHNSIHPIPKLLNSISKKLPHRDLTEHYQNENRQYASAYSSDVRIPAHLCRQYFLPDVCTISPEFNRSKVIIRRRRGSFKAHLAEAGSVNSRRLGSWIRERDRVTT